MKYLALILVSLTLLSGIGISAPVPIPRPAVWHLSGKWHVWDREQYEVWEFKLGQKDREYAIEGGQWNSYRSEFDVKPAIQGRWWTVRQGRDVVLYVTYDLDSDDGVTIIHRRGKGKSKVVYHKTGNEVFGTLTWGSKIPHTR